ncbi:hypothetical protein AB9K34_09560 [Sedimentitalea sp. XS_ASV28]|uniref:hypothetical protein n=1 Tax=Sedimentitalea sp. XS_ASV28 TaxID=3241296 RepID=UPI003517F7AC
MTDSMKSRINRMYMGDVFFAFGFVVVLWAVVIFVFLSVVSLIGGGAISNVLLLGAALVLLFNTAAIIAMIRHYAHDKDFIYGLDIRHLDEMKQVKRQG